MTIRSLVTQWHVYDENRFLGLINRSNPWPAATTSYRVYDTGADKPKVFPTREEAVAWIVARDAVQIEVPR